VSRLAEFGKFGVDGAEPGVGPVMLGVPLPTSIDFGTELLDGLFGAGDLAFGLQDVVREAVNASSVVTVAGHLNTDVPPRTLNNVYRQAGLRGQ